MPPIELLEHRITEDLRILKKGVQVWNSLRENAECQADLREVDLSGANLAGANLCVALLNGAVLIGADLSDADLRGADFRDVGLRDLKGHSDIQWLRVTYLTGATLRNANLKGAKLSFADLSNADLTNADLSCSDLSHACLKDANLTGADLSFVDLTEANLAGAIFSGSRMSDTRLTRVDLSQSHGLETVKHHHYSILDTSTLERSRGTIPERFLRGCGLSNLAISAARLYDHNLAADQLIDMSYDIVSSRLNSPIQIQPLFISYSHKDSEFVDALEFRLIAAGIRFWRDIHDMIAGPMEIQVDRAIRYNPIVLLVLSENSIESDWVEWEVVRTRQLAKSDSRYCLCPIALDQSWKSSRWDARLRAQIERYNIVDFAEWRSEDRMSYSFQKLINGLSVFYPQLAQ
ncbi:MAG TPA: toll/interleukin-1 receptor domain-containing protein [Thermoanaerobaculia bacterium]|jgi:uncharacterized protein YjbI with pentapeptide repeats